MNPTYRPAAAVVPYRNDELLCGFRGDGACSFKGYLVFPGGTLEPQDHDCPVLLPSEMSGTTPAHVVCALRELGEETGRFCIAQKNGDPANQVQQKQLFERLLQGEPLHAALHAQHVYLCLLYTSPSPRDQRGSRMPSSA